MPTVSPTFLVLWKFRNGRVWHSAAFGDRQAALECFFAWMHRGVKVRWKPA
jgi:hypothetical protein